MSSAPLTTAQLFKQLQEELASVRRQLLFVAGGSHASGDAIGTQAMRFDVAFFGEGEYSFTAFLQRNRSLENVLEHLVKAGFKETD